MNSSVLFVLLALLVALSAAIPAVCDGDCTFLPLPCYSGKVAYPGTIGKSYLDLNVINNGGLLKVVNNGSYASFCIEIDKYITPGAVYNWASQSSLDGDFANIMKYDWGLNRKFENFDNVNWLLTHTKDYQNYNSADFQAAIWQLLIGTSHGGDTVRVNKLISDATSLGEGFYPNGKDDCYGVVMFPSSHADCTVVHTAQTQFVKFCFYDFMPCKTANPNQLSAECSNHGYCLEGETNKILACSCVPGYAGRNCETELAQHDNCVNTIESPTVSTFQTTVGGNIDSCGNLHLSITAPIENSRNEDANNYAAWTRLIFKHQDSCDYPESTRSFWEIVDDPANTCFQKYEACTSFQDLIKCIGDDSFCRDSTGQEIPCNPSSCVTPPCDKCYRGQVQANRAYVRTSENGLLTDTASAENCHYFQVCLPWIQETKTNITVFKKPELQNDMIVGKVSYSCFNDESDCPKSKSWTISILSSVGYPLGIKETSEDSGVLAYAGGALPLHGITDISGCGVKDDFCVQELKFLLPGCDSLSSATTFNITGFKYGCYDTTDSTCLDFEASIDPVFLVATALLEIEGTQNNCGHDLTIEDGADSISLQMASYLDDYVTANTVFVYSSDTDNAFFKINVITSVDVSSVDIVTLSRTVNNNTSTVTFTTATCPAPTADELTDAGTDFLTSVCFSVDFNGLGALLNDNSLFTVKYVAKVELNYGFRKRQVGLNTGYELDKQIRILNRQQETSQSSSAMSVAAAIVPLGLMFL